MKISIVIPTKNEQDNLAEIIQGCREHCDELIVVDGHSTDDTRKVAESHDVRVILDNKRGKGDGIRHSVNFVSGDVILFIDADGSHDTNDIPIILAPIIADEADMVIGSRMRGGSDELHGDIFEFIRLIGSSIITLGINYRFNARLTDSQNGFRAIRTSTIKDLQLKEDITTIEQEMLIKALRKGHRVVDVPTHEYQRKSGVSKISVRKVAFRYVYTWLKYMFIG